MLKTNCIRQPQSYFPVHLATTIHTLNSLITAVLPSPGYNFLTATQRREDMTSHCSDNLYALITFQGQESWMQVTRITLWTKSRRVHGVFY